MKLKSDQIDSRIAEWERMRAEFGPAAPASVAGLIDHEVAKLRRRRAAEESLPLSGR